VSLNKHSDLAGKHAFLSASKYHWLRYSDEKLAQSWLTAMAAARGTRLHDLAMHLIKEGIRLEDTQATLNAYVNDAIGFRMTPEQILYFSDNCFGTADALSFRDSLLRIHDLKTGVNEASFDQLLIYAAIFCLEYEMSPATIEIELRIYQNDAVKVLEPDPHDVIEAMDKIRRFDEIIERTKWEVRA
jgi:hypothetical protein